MLTVSPGPSQLFEDIREDIVTAAHSGILEISHRSKEFTDISRKAITELRTYLSIPDDYLIMYFDSASHIWHSMAANVVEKKSFHFVNGAFSGKAREAAKLLYKEVESQEVPWGEPIDVRFGARPEALGAEAGPKTFSAEKDFWQPIDVRFGARPEALGAEAGPKTFSAEKDFWQPSDVQSAVIAPDTELITVCYNETSTGCKLLAPELSYLRAQYPDILLAVDTVSCAGAIPLNIRDADLWYFSVQKCFGMPSGMGILIMSPRAYEKSLKMMTDRTNLAGMWAWKHHIDMMANDMYQTPQTPNVLNIFLLGQQCARLNAAGGLTTTLKHTLNKKLQFESFITDNPQYSWFVQDEEHRSDTVFTVGADRELIVKAHTACLERGIILGTGYGKAKADTFRVANFPAITEDHLAQLMDVLGTIE